MEITLDGVIIRETPIHDSDMLLTVLTGRLGKITVLAKSVKKTTSKNAPGTQLFCYSEFDLIEKNGRYILKTVTPKQSFYGIRSDILGFALASYVLDAVGAVANEGIDETDVLRLLLNTLHVLSEKKAVPLWLIKGAFELKLMQVCGYMPFLEYCPICTCDIPEDEPCHFSLSEGCVVCSKCNKNAFLSGAEIPNTISVSYPVVQAMRFICESQINRFLSFRLDESLKGEFSFVTEKYLLYRTERSFETLKIYKNMVNSIGEN